MGKLTNITVIKVGSNHTRLPEVKPTVEILISNNLAAFWFGEHAGHDDERIDIGSTNWYWSQIAPDYQAWFLEHFGQLPLLRRTNINRPLNRKNPKHVTIFHLEFANPVTPDQCAFLAKYDEAFGETYVHLTYDLVQRLGYGERPGQYTWNRIGFEYVPTPLLDPTRCTSSWIKEQSEYNTPDKAFDGALYDLIIQHKCEFIWNWNSKENFLFLPTDEARLIYKMKWAS
jgi:hypothetical protein